MQTIRANATGAESCPWFDSMTRTAEFIRVRIAASPHDTLSGMQQHVIRLILTNHKTSRWICPIMVWMMNHGARW